MKPKSEKIEVIMVLCIEGTAISNKQTKQQEKKQNNKTRQANK